VRWIYVAGIFKLTFSSYYCGVTAALARCSGTVGPDHGLPRFHGVFRGMVPLYRSVKSLVRAILCRPANP
jgi:hypothetical protein